MKKMLKIIKNVVLYIWQLPQNLLGLFLILFYRPDEKIRLDNGNLVYFSTKMPGGISLGMYSIVNKYYLIALGGNKEIVKNLDVVKHEGLGHGTQSRYLGPLYLFVIGLPSIIWASIYGSLIPYTHNGYYVFFTERWADKLAGVIRK